MKILHGGIAAGKTHRAVGWVKAGPSRAIMVHSLREKQRIISQYQIDPRQVLVFGENKNRWFGTGRREICIDNLDMILAQICSPHNPVMFTVTEWPDVESLGDYNEYVQSMRKKMPEEFDKYYTGRWEVTPDDEDNKTRD